MTDDYGMTSCLTRRQPDVIRPSLRPRASQLHRAYDVPSHLPSPVYSLAAEILLIYSRVFCFLHSFCHKQRRIQISDEVSEAELLCVKLVFFCQFAVSFSSSTTNLENFQLLGRIPPDPCIRRSSDLISPFLLCIHRVTVT